MMSGVMPNCSWQKKVPERPMTGLDLVEDHEGLVAAAERLRLLPELVGRQVDPLALNRLGDERRHVAPPELSGQGGGVTEGDHVAARQQRTEAAAELSSRR